MYFSEINTCMHNDYIKDFEYKIIGDVRTSLYRSVNYSLSI